MTQSSSFLGPSSCARAPCFGCTLQESLTELSAMKGLTFIYILCTYFYQIGRASASTDRLARYASKTRYHGEAGPWPRPEGCQPKHIDMLIRHGTRHPSKKDVKKIQEMLNVVNPFFNASSPFRNSNLYLPWKNQFYVEKDKILTHTGKQEMRKLSLRMMERFPELLDPKNLHESYTFHSTDTSRTLESASAFAAGLFGEKSDIPIVSVDKNKDILLRFFDQCPRYKSEVSENKTALYHTKRFREGKEMNDVLGKVVTKLGLTTEQQKQVKPKHVTAMYVACSFEVALFDRHNAWCSLFDAEDFAILEYLYDLKHFWKRAYGYKINYRISCTLLSDIVRNMQQRIEQMQSLSVGKIRNTGKLGVFRFAHAETLQPLYALLGLFKDAEELRADNFAKQRFRKYRTSLVAPFGANIAFVLYSCNDSEHENSLKDFQVQVYVGEKLVPLSCGDDVSCTLADFLSLYSELLNSCDLNELCKMGENNLKHEEL